MELKTTEGNILYNENKIIELMNSYASTLRTIFSETFDDKTKRLFYTSNVVGEYAELLVSSKLHLTKEIASKKDYDYKLKSPYGCLLTTDCKIKTCFDAIYHTLKGE